MIRIGRMINGAYTPVSGFRPIVITTASSPYASLSPFCLRDEKGRFHENIWQSSKVYMEVPASRQTYSRWNSTVIWEHPYEVHTDDQGLPNQAYFAWRHKLANNPYPVRYPVGFQHRHKCLYALKETGEGLIEPWALGYIAARKEIYGKEYLRLVEKQPQYRELKDRLARGENLLLIDVDGPHQEGMSYYQEKYQVTPDFITNNSVLASEYSLNLLLNDEKFQYGHAFFLAASLLNIALK